MLEGIPEGWREVRLGEVLDQAKRSEAPSKLEDYELCGVRLYGNGLRSQGIISGVELKSPSVSRLRTGDITYNKMWASKGAFAVVTSRHDGLFVTSEYPIFKTDEGGADYIKHLCRQPRFWHRANDWSIGTTDRARLGPKDFLRLPVVLPAFPERRAIVAVLDAADAALAASEAQIAATIRQKRQVMRTLLTRGTAGNAAGLVALKDRWVAGRVSEGIEQIPRDWTLVRLTSVARLESGHTPSREHPEYWGGDVPWVSLNDTGRLDAATITETEESVTELGLAKSSARLLPTDTVLFSRTATVGKITRLGCPMATSQDFANWVCTDLLSPRYLVQVFRGCEREWRRLQSGSTHQTIYMPDFKRLQILLPPLAEQLRIAEVGEAFDARIEAERRVSAQARALKNTLASELLSGRTRLPASFVAQFEDSTEEAA